MPAWRRRRGVIFLAAVLLLVTVVVLRGINKGEFHLNADEAHHAVTGLYFADFLSDLPLADPVQYTYQYYAQYPALGLIHWPPFFHFVEGIMFLLLGPSVVTARLTVLLFALLGFYFWFKLVSELQNEFAAAVSTLLLALLPALLLYEKAVMLEVPSLSLCIAASYFWIQYLRQGKSRLLYWFALFASLALLTKQTSIYLATFCLLTLLVGQKWRLLMNLTAIRAFGLSVLIVSPFYTLAFAVHSQSIAADVFKGLAHSANPFAYYWLTLPDQLGWTLLGLSAFGIATWRWWDRCENAVPMLLWILACYLTFTSFALREPRLILYWLPPLVYFATSPLAARSLPARVRPVAAAAVLALLGSHTLSAWAYERPYVSGYKAMARRVMESINPGIVLFDGSLSGNFIFHVRTLDPGRRCIVLRKALYATRITKEYGNLGLVHTRAELERLIKRYGIKYIVVLDTAPLRFEAQKILRELLQTDEFTLVQAFPIESNIPEWQESNLLLYENNQVMPRTAKFLRLRMLTVDQDIVIPLAELERR